MSSATDTAISENRSPDAAAHRNPASINIIVVANGPACPNKLPALRRSSSSSSAPAAARIAPPFSVSCSAFRGWVAHATFITKIIDKFSRSIAPIMIGRLGERIMNSG
jgi:hypothetical protein